MNQPDFELARDNMILNQVRSWGVLDEKVVDLLSRFPREHFVEPKFRGVAYADTMLPLSQSRLMLAPSLEARLLQAVAATVNDHILVVGTGNGYLTALLAASAAYVTSVDSDKELVEKARVRLQEAGIANVRVETGDATKGWSNHAPYDGILVAGAVAQIAPEFMTQLSQGGRLVGIEGGRAPQKCVRITRQSDGNRREELFETEFAYFEGADPKTEFQF